jgi:hypothetical protein
VAVELFDAAGGGDGGAACRRHLGAVEQRLARRAAC